MQLPPTIYKDISVLGIKLEDVQSLDSVLAAMPYNSILVQSYYQADTMTFFDKGLIPTKETGVLEIYKQAKSFARFTCYPGMYFRSGNQDSLTYNSWKKVQTEDI